MTKNHLYSIVITGALTFYALVACSPENNTAGGFSEETNTLAGILVNENGEPQANVRVFARHTKANISDLFDTTDSEGNFEIPLSRQGTYGLSATKGKKAMYKMFSYNGQSVKVKAELVTTTDISSNISLREDSIATDVDVSIPGSPWGAKTSSEGKFSFQKVPEGVYPVLAKSPDPLRFEDAFYVAEFKNGKANFNGPYPSKWMEAIMAHVTKDSVTISNEIDEESRKFDMSDAVSSSKLMLPLSAEYGVLGWWPLDYVNENSNTSSDVRGRMGDVIFYGDVKRAIGFATDGVEFKTANQYGIVENVYSLLDSATGMTLETWVNIPKMPKSKSYRMNIVGELSFRSNTNDTVQDVFSLSLVKGECAAESPSLAFFIAGGAKGDSLSCDNVVLSNKINVGDWVYVTAVWNGSELAMYFNGMLVATSKTNVKYIKFSSESLIFGKEDLNLKLDDVRLSNNAINNADVFYRYYEQIGGKP